MTSGRPSTWLHGLGVALGIGAFVTAGVAIVSSLVVGLVFVAPLVFWFAWNVLDFGEAIGLSELGFLAIVLAALFLVAGWLARALVTAVVFIVDPAWLSESAELHWPEPTIKNYIAVLLLAALAASPHLWGRGRHD